jgi:hypothetical protein
VKEDDSMKILGREPTLYIAVLNAVVILLGTFQFHLLSGTQAALIVVAINAVFASLNAAAVRPCPRWRSPTPSVRWSQSLRRTG